jgi:MFS family permease
VGILLRFVVLLVHPFHVYTAFIKPPVITDTWNQDIGWKWTFGICAILFGVFVILVILFVPETSYNRLPLAQRYPGMDVHYGDHEKPKEVVSSQQSGAHASEYHSDNAPSEPKNSYLHSLRVYNGRFTNAPFWKITIRPVVMFWYPAVLWAFLIYGTTLTWIVVFSVVNASIFTLPPYNFSVSQTGLVSLSPFILTIIGEVIAGPLNDWICLWLAKRNHGVYEPEYRLVLIIVVMLLGIAGFFGFGASVHYQTHWIGPVLTFGLANMAMAFANGCVFGYVLDSYEELSEEGNSPAFPFLLSIKLFTEHLLLTIGVDSFRSNQRAQSPNIWSHLLRK